MADLTKPTRYQVTVTFHIEIFRNLSRKTKAALQADCFKATESIRPNTRGSAHFLAENI